MPRQYTPRVECTCQKCGKVFHRKPSQVAKYALHYCSRECRTVKVQCTCHTCGRTFMRIPSRVQKSGGRFCSGSCARQGPNSARWNGGRWIATNGYVIRTIPGRGRITEHRWVWEQAYGPIPDGYVVHHVDGNRQNNDLSNLTLMTPSDHSQLHRRLDGLNGRWSRDYDACIVCGTTSRKHQGHGLCTRCYKRRRNGYDPSVQL